MDAAPAGRIHKQAWASKGDVYHLLFDICWFIYGNTWPREDSVLVYLLFALIQHTTGVQPRADARPRCWYPKSVLVSTIAKHHAAACVLTPESY